jgi:hypothetical protein
MRGRLMRDREPVEGTERNMKGHRRPPGDPLRPHLISFLRAGLVDLLLQDAFVVLDLSSILFRGIPSDSADDL